MLLRVDEITDARKTLETQQELLRFRAAVVNLIAYIHFIPPQYVTDKQIEDWLELFQ